MGDIKVSVIVPVYKAERYIAKCLDSLVNQTLQKIEIIVVNDGSPDNSQTIIDDYARRYPEKIRSFIKRNEGVSEARNFGVRQARGEYLGFVDSDDYVDIQMYESLLKTAEETGSEVVCCGFCYEKANSSEEIYLDNIDAFSYSAIQKPALLDSANSFAWNKLFKRELWKRGHFEFPKGRIYEDSAVIYNTLLTANKIEQVNHCFYHYLLTNVDSIVHKADERVFQIFESCDSIRFFFEPYCKDNAALHDMMVYLCLKHLMPRVKQLILNQETDLLSDFLEKLFDYLNRNLPIWRNFAGIMEIEAPAEALQIIRTLRQFGFEEAPGLSNEKMRITVRMQKSKSGEDRSASYAANPVAFYIANSPQVYAALPLIDALKEKGISCDIIMPDCGTGESDWEQIWLSTKRLLIDRGHAPRCITECDWRYRIVCAPYDDDVLKLADCTVKYRYCVIASKVEFGYHPRNTLPFDYTLCYGEQDKNAFDAYGRTLIIGNPRALGLIKKQCGENAKKRIIYAPTYRAKLDFNAIGDALERLKEKYDIILKLHPGSEFLDDEKTVSMKLRSSCTTYTDGNDDIMRMLEETDLLLSDYSGTVFDAMSIGVPAAIVRCGEQNPGRILNDGTILSQMITKGEIPCCYHAEELEQCIEQALDQQGKKKQSEVAKKIFSMDPAEGLNVFTSFILQILKDGINADYKTERKRLSEYERLLREEVAAQQLKIEKLIAQQLAESELQIAEIQEMRASTSWKITKPLRMLRVLLLRLREYQNKSK